MVPAAETRPVRAARLTAAGQPGVQTLVVEFARAVAPPHCLAAVVIPERGGPATALHLTGALDRLCGEIDAIGGEPVIDAAPLTLAEAHAALAAAIDRTEQRGDPLLTPAYGEVRGLAQQRLALLGSVLAASDDQVSGSRSSGS
ncbi:hypothetical protein [Patulibacter defluvii]|uniref:hypothetical protein n=1 Tax=Patulibacter defluvii TaxID=3095358 RepID=UPI002A751F0F|nr:hypothetical protein [Patulibacter sp. DM4]